MMANDVPVPVWLKKKSELVNTTIPSGGVGWNSRNLTNGQKDHEEKREKEYSDVPQYSRFPNEHDQVELTPENDPNDSEKSIGRIKEELVSDGEFGFDVEPRIRKISHAQDDEADQVQNPKTLLTRKTR